MVRLDKGHHQGVNSQVMNFRMFFKLGLVLLLVLPALPCAMALPADASFFAPPCMACPDEPAPEQELGCESSPDPIVCEHQRLNSGELSVTLQLIDNPPKFVALQAHPPWRNLAAPVVLAHNLPLVRHGVVAGPPANLRHRVFQI